MVTFGQKIRGYILYRNIEVAALQNDPYTKVPLPITVLLVILSVFQRWGQLVIIPINNVVDWYY